MYERSRLHPPFTVLVWRFPHRCVLYGPSIEPGLAAVATSHARHPSSFVCLPCFIRTHFSHGQGSIPRGSLACCTFYYTDEASRLLSVLTDTTQKIDTQRFQVAAVMGTSVPRVTPPDPRPEGRGPRLFFDFLGRELTFFRNSLQGEGREWEKETPCGKGLGSWDT